MKVAGTTAVDRGLGGTFGMVNALLMVVALMAFALPFAPEIHRKFAIRAVRCQSRLHCGTGAP